MPVMYMGNPRFSYGGFSYLMVDPWPSDWSKDTYPSDDVYIDYDSVDAGYYLYDRRYPQGEARRLDRSLAGWDSCTPAPSPEHDRGGREFPPTASYLRWKSAIFQVSGARAEHPGRAEFR